MMMKTLGVVFPGQGSQSVGMLADVARDHVEVEKIFKQASDVLGYDLWQLVQSGPTEVLDKTTHTQPALLTASYALWKLVRHKNANMPGLLAGHSLGEYTALVCANALDFTDAVRLVAARGEYMQDAVPVGQGGLAAIVGLDDAAVKVLCEKSLQNGEVLTPVNFNSPGQVVIGGHLVAVERAIVLAKDAGARMAKLLPVSVPSHCVLMKPAAERLAALLKTLTIRVPEVPVLNNVDVSIYQDAEQIRNGLTRQLYMPVRWVETIKAFEQAGVTQIIECGPGKVLNGLNKRIVTTDMQLMNVVEALSG